MLSFPEIKMGKVIVYNDEPCLVIKCDFLKMNRAKPSKKCVLKGLVSGKNLPYTFNSGENVEEADLVKHTASYLYNGGDTYSFMDNESFETLELNVDLLGGKEGYLVEGQEVFLVYYNDGVIAVDMPIKVSLKVAHTDPAAKGNTVSNVMKDAKLETGKVVKVPAFIKTGEMVVVNTVEDSYVERDNS